MYMVAFNKGYHKIDKLFSLSQKYLYIYLVRKHYDFVHVSGRKHIESL